MLLLIHIKHRNFHDVADGAVVHTNLYVAGGIIAGSERWREKSGDGIAVATAVRAADHITGGAR